MVKKFIKKNLYRVSIWRVIGEKKFKFNFKCASTQERIRKRIIFFIFILVTVYLLYVNELMRKKKKTFSLYSFSLQLIVD